MSAEEIVDPLRLFKVNEVATTGHLLVLDPGREVTDADAVFEQAPIHTAVLAPVYGHDPASATR